MNRTTTIIAGAIALLGGAGLIIVADQQGWLSAWNEPAARVPSPASTTERPIRTAAVPRSSTPDVQAQIRLASNVTELEPLPRVQRAPSLVCSNHLKVVDLMNDRAAADAGIIVEAVRETPVTHMISCNAAIAFNDERLAHVSARAPGVVKQVMKRAGDRVTAGETLALIDSTELASAKAELLQAATLVSTWSDRLERLRPLAAQDAVPKRDLIEAETNLAEARIDVSRATQHLRNLGVDQPGIDAVLAGDAGTSTLAVVAPFDGIIIERNAVLDQNIDTQHVIFVVVDTSTMWAMLDVRPNDLRNVSAGQRVLISLSGLEGEAFAGEIAWVSAAVDPVTRTLKARADLANDSGVLRANMFGQAQIVVSQDERQLVVPKDAVQWDGCCNLVFVRQTESLFQPFKVRLGADLGEHYVVKAGLRADDQIVTRGAFLLKTELMKDSIGAGCCEAEGVVMKDK